MILRPLLNLGIARYFKDHDYWQGLNFFSGNLPLSDLPPSFWDWWHQEHARLEEGFQQWLAQGIKCTHPGQEDYPSSFLYFLERPPLCLFYKGQASWMTEKVLAVVGSRKIMAQSSLWIHSVLREFLRAHPVSLVSGGARGVDQEAHLCAMRAQRPTYAFLPSGLNQIYPKDFEGWQEDIIKGGGALISEYSPEETIKKYHFTERNRLLVAFSQAVIVVQGECRSGTLMTARWTMEMGKPLGVVPGHPTDSYFNGNLKLLREGVPPQIDAMDILALLGQGGLPF